MAKQSTFPHGNRRMAPKRRRAGKRTGPLAAWLKFNPSSLTDFSALVGCSVQHISHLVHGQSRPSIRLALAIEQATGGAVGVESWT